MSVNFLLSSVVGRECQSNIPVKATPTVAKVFRTP